MSVAYHHLKMRFTRRTVDYVRYFCDGCNYVFSIFTSPFHRIGQRISAEAPWVVVIIASTLITVVPIVGYPYLKPVLGQNPRFELEEERVRLCLQKGIDPYPYMRHKDLVYGNQVTLFSSESENPKEAAWEYLSLKEFYRRKEALRQQVDGDLDDTVQKLLDLRKRQLRQFDSQRREINRDPEEYIFTERPDTDKLIT
ncbi:unnamed protein product [Phytomonas sp. Hart1]|nr:unnamed protein product [Phytomonas sp. Hart1]|eukprot:CCW66428.1 unnamed protein product [Phytomonas sp. isolate Hart1]